VAPRVLEYLPAPHKLQSEATLRPVSAVYFPLSQRTQLLALVMPISDE
jgi:hypothetical protein